MYTPKPTLQYPDFPHLSLEDLGNSIKSLKEDADSWSGLAREVQSMLPDIKHMRVEANATIDSESLPGTSQCAIDCRCHA